eukprot:69346_1
MASQQQYPSYSGYNPPIQYQQQQQYPPIHSNNNINNNNINNNMSSAIPPNALYTIPTIPSYPIQHIPQQISYNTARPVRGHGLAPCTPQYHPFPPLPPSIFPSPIIEPPTNTNNFTETK